MKKRLVKWGGWICLGGFLFASWYDHSITPPWFEDKMMWVAISIPFIIFFVGLWLTRGKRLRPTTLHDTSGLGWGDWDNRPMAGDDALPKKGR